MERRLLNSLTAERLATHSRTNSPWRRLSGFVTHHSATQNSQPDETRFRFPAPLWPWSLATAALVAVAIVLATHPRSGTPAQISGTRHDVRTVITPNRTLPQPVTVAALVPVSHPHRKPHIVPGPTVPPEPTAASCHCDPVALAETLAPSKPAPPLPLTAQEVMLRRIVSHGNTVELAQLDPRIRARSTARERAQFQNFFAPSSTGDKE